MTFDRAVEHLLRRDRWVVGAGLGLMTLLAWWYLVAYAAGMYSMPLMESTMAMGFRMTFLSFRTWKVAEGLMIFTMWAIMMVAMMTPSATPIVLLYARVCRRQRVGGTTPYGPTGLFFLGYLALWTVFSATATGVQWAFAELALLSPMMVSISPILSGTLLVLAGIYQFLPAKQACLRHCQSPVEYLSRHWRSGIWGAFQMGLEHGLYCLGCCWAIMLLLFVGGVMSLLWIAAISILVLAEKVLPYGRLVGLVGGALFIVAGLVVIL